MNLNDYRAITVADENDNPICVMMVHDSVSDKAVRNVFEQYTCQMQKRYYEHKIKECKTGRSVEWSVHAQHRLNILKKAVRLDEEMNGFVLVKRTVVHGGLVDCYNADEKNRSLFRRELVDGYLKDDMPRVIETDDEKNAYKGVSKNETVTMEKVYFVAVRPKVVQNLNLFAEDEK